MIKDYSDLFERMCALAGKPVSEYEVFYEDWRTICAMSDFDTVLKAWEQIKLENTFYFVLKVWNDKLDQLEAREIALKPEEKKSRVDMDEDMKAWRANSRKFIGGRQTIKEYLGNCLLIKQMNKEEVDKEFERYKRLGYDFDKPISNKGVLSGQKKI